MNKRSIRLSVLALVMQVFTACAGTSSGSLPSDSAPLPTFSPAASEAHAPLPGIEARAASPVRGGELQVHFLDVGQGDATLVQTAGATMLIDTGRHDRSAVVGLLRERGVSAIDVVAITHGHADHIGQLPEVLDAFPVEEVWMSGTPHTTSTFERALAAVERSQAAYEEPRAGQSTTVGELQVDVVHPARLGQGLHGDSLSLRITYGAVSFLFTGDAETVTEAEMVARDPALVRATVYQAGHHGSGTSTSAGFLAAVAPEVAVWSAGRNSQYGHPHSSVVERLTSAGVKVFGTAVDGTVTVTTNGSNYSVNAGPATAPAAPRAPPPIAGGARDCAPGQVDVNRADSVELQRIIHIGTTRAGYILDLRPIASVDDLIRVHGIGPARLADIKSQGLACV